MSVSCHCNVSLLYAIIVSWKNLINFQNQFDGVHQVGFFFYAKGGIYENLVSDILVKRGYKLNYYKTENASQEIEFLITTSAGVIPIEVKAGNGTSVSLNTFIDEFKPMIAYKLITGNIGVIDTKTTLPLYMAMFI